MGQKAAKMQRTTEDVPVETNTTLHGNVQHGYFLKIGDRNRQETGVGPHSQTLPHLHTMFSGSLTLHSDTNVKADGKVQRFCRLKLGTTNPQQYGVEVSREDIVHTVNEIFEEKRAQSWSNATEQMELIDSKLSALLGPKTAANNEKPVKKEKEKPATVEEKSTTEEALKPSEEDINPYLIFPEPEENYKVHTEVFFSDGRVLRACM